MLCLLCILPLTFPCVPGPSGASQVQIQVEQSFQGPYIGSIVGVNTIDLNLPTIAVGTSFAIDFFGVWSNVTAGQIDAVTSATLREPSVQQTGTRKLQVS